MSRNLVKSIHAITSDTRFSTADCTEAGDPCPKRPEGVFVGVDESPLAGSGMDRDSKNNEELVAAVFLTRGKTEVKKCEVMDRLDNNSDSDNDKYFTADEDETSLLRTRSVDGEGLHRVVCTCVSHRLASLLNYGKADFEDTPLQEALEANLVQGARVEMAAKVPGCFVARAQGKKRLRSSEGMTSAESGSIRVLKQCKIRILATDVVHGQSTHLPVSPTILSIKDHLHMRRDNLVHSSC